jgi:hypothetical protein
VTDLFQALQEGEKIVDLAWIELKCGHCGMPGVDPFRKCLGEGLDRIAKTKVAERRCYCTLAWARPVYGAASSEIRVRERSAAHFELSLHKDTDEQERAIVSSKPRSGTESRVTKGTRPKLAPNAAAKQHADELLDEALDQTVPASDPPFITRDTHAT